MSSHSHTPPAIACLVATDPTEGSQQPVVCPLEDDDDDEESSRIQGGRSGFKAEGCWLIGIAYSKYITCRSRKDIDPSRYGGAMAYDRLSGSLEERSLIKTSYRTTGAYIDLSWRNRANDVPGDAATHLDLSFWRVVSGGGACIRSC